MGQLLDDEFTVGTALQQHDVRQALMPVGSAHANDAIGNGSTCTVGNGLRQATDFVPFIVSFVIGRNRVVIYLFAAFGSRFFSKVATAGYDDFIADGSGERCRNAFVTACFERRQGAIAHCVESIVVGRSGVLGTNVQHKKADESYQGDKFLHERGLRMVNKIGQRGGNECV